jgi:glucoamylase
LKCLVEAFVAGNTKLQQTIQQYISAQAYLQTVSGLSGGLATGGLGEPKYYVNGTAFTGPWGRPQKDGPALRATTLIAFAKWLIVGSPKFQTAHITTHIEPLRHCWQFPLFLEQRTIFLGQLNSLADCPE